MIRIGIICPSEIALRRFMPALKKNKKFEYVGISYPTNNEWDNASQKNIEKEKSKAIFFQSRYGGKVYEGYQTLIESKDIDAIYIPLPPALHYYWAKKSLENGKHVFLEKPSTTCLEHTCELINISKEMNLALHENYMFQYHEQINIIKKMIDDEIVGKIRLIRGDFGFPKREDNDFRYNKLLGGGALIDCGGYPIKLISILLGQSVSVDSSQLFSNKKGVDIYGSVQMSTGNIAAQISFGMDNAYKCNFEVWGSNGTIYTNRIFTAPDNLIVDIYVHTENNQEVIQVSADDTFCKSLDVFYECIINEKTRFKEYAEILLQSKLINDVQKGEIK